jgi:general secretion pathway protein D
MHLKLIFSFCLLLALAPVLSAQTNLGANQGGLLAQAQPPQPGPPVPTLPSRPPAATQPRTIPTPSAPLTPAVPPARAQTVPPNPGQTTPVAQRPATAAPAAPAASQATAVEEANIEYHFPAVPLEQLLDIYSELVGRTLLRASVGASAIPANSMITLSTETKLTRSEAIVALETVLGMNGVTIVPIGDKFAKVVAEAAAPGAGGNILTNKSTFLPEAGKFVTEVVQVKFADAEQLTKALIPFAKSQNSIILIPSTQTLVLRDYSENVKRMLEMVEKIDVLTPLVVKPRVVPIRYALASDIAQALSALGASGGTSVGRSSSGGTFQPRSGTTSVNNSFGSGGMGVQGGMGGAGGYPGSPTQSPLSSAATGARGNFQNNLNRIVQNAAQSGQFTLFGQTKIIADERTNSLLVFANDEDMKTIMDIIDKLDVVLAQVLIEALVLEVNLDQTRNLGVSYLASKVSGGSTQGLGGVNNLSSSASGFLSGSSSSVANGVTNVTSTSGGNTLSSLPGGFSYFGKFGNNLDVVAEAVAGDSRISVLSRPRIQTSHAVPANLFIGNTVPYVTGTYNYGYGSGPSSQYTQLEVGITLQVLPLINPDGLVVMDIQTDIEQLGAPVTIAGVGDVPTTTKRQAGAKVAVKNGETVILGGFISADRSKKNAGVPFFKDIPLFGALFRSSAIENQRTELIILLRPTVLATPEIAARTATIERGKMAAVKQAEFEIRLDEDSRNKKAAEEMRKQAEKKAEDEKKEAKKNAAKPVMTNSAPDMDDVDLER